MQPQHLGLHREPGLRTPAQYQTACGELAPSMQQEVSTEICTSTAGNAAGAGYMWRTRSHPWSRQCVRHYPFTPGNCSSSSSKLPVRSQKPCVQQGACAKSCSSIPGCCISSRLPVGSWKPFMKHVGNCPFPQPSTASTIQGERPRSPALGCSITYKAGSHPHTPAAPV